MDSLIEKRKPVRTSFTKTSNAILQELEKEIPVEKIIKTKLLTLERLSNELSTLDTQILNMEFTTTDLFENEWAKIEEYKEKLDSIRVETGLFFDRQTTPSVGSISPNLNKRKLKLPEIE